MRGLGRQLENYAKSRCSKKSTNGTTILEMVDEMYKEMHIPAEKDIFSSTIKFIYSSKTGYTLAPMVEKLAKRKQ